MWEQLQRLTGSLSRKQQILILVVAAAVAGGLYYLVHQRQEQDFKPLFTGLAPEDANQVISKLKEANTEYRLGENGASVLVRSARLAEMRLQVAGSGLPKSGRLGFEIFDKTNFGLTEFSEHINHQRALEGELERSVTSLSEVEQARIHITFPKESVFTEQRRPAKASVLVRLRRDAVLSQKNVTAIEHLVANAVEGLTAENVNVVDMQGNLLKKIPASAEDQTKDSNIEYRQKIERDLLAKVQATLNPILGPDHFQAGVSAEVDFSSGEQSEEAFDPNRSVMLTQQRTEETTAPNASAGVPGTASNLPRPPTRAGSSSMSQTKRTENISYQTSRTVRKTTLPVGNLRRVSVSALVDQTVRWEGTGPKAKRILEAPSEETLQKVRDLVSAAVGFNEERGDQITIQSLPFERTLRMSAPPPDPGAPKATPPTSTTAPPSQLPFGLDRLLAEKGIKVDPMIILGAAAAILLTIIVGGLFFLMKKGKKNLDAGVHVPEAIAGVHATHAVGPASSHAVAHKVAHHPVSGAQLTTEEAEAAEAERVAQLEREVLNSIGVPDGATKKGQVLIKHISEQAKRDPIGVAQLMRSWVTEKER
ncbi:MAG: flagellar M-ring protein FliF [Acidobacteria bacterium]|nr:flagellar M-ring protein FliF [Acidobacteriota bacterium]